jgi:hypothetical protein
MSLNPDRSLTLLQFSGKENEVLESSIDRHINDLVNLLERKYVSTATSFRALDFALAAQYFTMVSIFLGCY